MATLPITIQVDAEAARVDTDASPQDRMKIEMPLSLHLQDFVTNPPGPLSEVIDDISARAVQRGLTLEVLDSILRDEE